MKFWGLGLRVQDLWSKFWGVGFSHQGLRITQPKPFIDLTPEQEAPTYQTLSAKAHP